MTKPTKTNGIRCRGPYLWKLQSILFLGIPLLISAFSPAATRVTAVRRVADSGIALYSTSTRDDVCNVQILISDTGGGHRASANALRDALDVLYPGKFECDIVDIYTEYGPFWPFNGVVAAYKLMAKYSFLWDFFYHSGETEFGLWLNELILDTFCFEPFKQCLARPSGSSGKRADMVVSVHPLCQNPPLKILADLDSDGATRDPAKRKTPFVTVVTDLGGASKTWFNPK
jgi:1,2-diacylglycerol 3-beta-galactosyltransferase